jgi:hypothetical protein
MEFDGPSTLGSKPWGGGSRSCDFPGVGEDFSQCCGEKLKCSILIRKIYLIG